MSFLLEAHDYIQVVVAVLAALGAVFGLPIVYQTFRKTHAEITRINLESLKLRKELAERTSVSAGGNSASSYGVVDGQGNVMSLPSDPNWSGSILVLIDALIAGIYSTIASYVINFIPIFNILTGPIEFVVYLAIYYPVLRAALRVKKNLGADLKK